MGGACVVQGAHRRAVLGAENGHMTRRFFVSGLFLSWESLMFFINAGLYLVPPQYASGFGFLFLCVHG